MAALTFVDVINQQSNKYNPTNNLLLMILNELRGTPAVPPAPDPVLYALLFSNEVVGGQIDAGTYNSVEFFNSGDEIMTIGGARTLLPGQTFIVNGFPNELGNSDITYTFAGGGNPSVDITIRTYP